jgi:Fanconi anemia group M protein
MQHGIRHPRLTPGRIEARAYQLEATDEVLSGSMMLVLPTAAGKTVVAWMAIADRLESSDGWALMIAPTVALVEQHLRGIEPVLSDSSSVNPISVTGQNPVAKRAALWGSSRLVIATPQVVRNDVIRGVLDLSDCSLLVVDEAHHSTGEHAMAQVGDLYLAQASEPLVLATTASPGSKIDQVEEVCDRLGIGRIHLRTSGDPMVAKHLVGLDIQEVKVKVPDQIRELAEPLVMWQSGIVDRERRLGRYVRPGVISHAGLSNAMERAQQAISRGESSAYQSVSRIATAMRLHHLINHLLSQGVAASSEFLERLSRSEQAQNKSTRNFLRDGRVSSLRKSLSELGEVHTKIGAVRRLVSERLRRDSDSRIIVFATFRDTVAAVEKSLEELGGARPIQFVGQSSRGGRGGLTPKQQIERLDEFRSGSANVLVATSVGEEGLDIPSADLVVFYEPVPSEIRTIQRRGRTGRHREGEVVVLIAEDTRDEGARASAERREDFMQRAVHRVRRKLPRSHHTDLSNLGRFEVSSEDGAVSASEFVASQREMHRVEISESDESMPSEAETPPTLPPETFRARGQAGLEQFRGKSAKTANEENENQSPISRTFRSGEQVT